jgi:hypothetical protein
MAESQPRWQTGKAALAYLVRQMTGMSTTFTYGEIRAGRFRIGRRALWIQSEVQCWVRRKSRMLDAKKSPCFQGLF